MHILIHNAFNFYFAHNKLKAVMITSKLQF